jgi:hypothetical protein
LHEENQVAYNLAWLFRYQFRQYIFNLITMKKIILLTVISACFQVETEASNSILYKNATISETSISAKTAIKRRRKKGFLWGLFKKNDCGCPKH